MTKNHEQRRRNAKIADVALALLGHIDLSGAMTADDLRQRTPMDGRPYLDDALTLLRDAGMIEPAEATRWYRAGGAA
ncbi:hypothetical protein ABQE44_25365 [Mycolicibacterium sp. XJ2546]